MPSTWATWAGAGGRGGYDLEEITISAGNMRLAPGNIRADLFLPIPDKVTPKGLLQV